MPGSRTAIGHIRSARLSGLLALFLGIGLLPGQADAPVPLTAGAPQVVALDGVHAAWLVYAAGSWQTVTLAARSLEPDGALDTVLEVLDGDGRRVAYADDTAQGTDATIAGLPLAPGAYRLRVDSFNGVSAGRVEVSVTPVDQFAAHISVADGVTAIQALLPANSRYKYAYTLDADAAVTITARDTSGTLDPVLRVRDSDGGLVAMNDDHAAVDLALDTLDAQIAALALPAGAYTIEVTDFTGAAGIFELTVVRGRK